VRRETGKEYVVKVHCDEGLAIHVALGQPYLSVDGHRMKITDPDLCLGLCEGGIPIADMPTVEHVAAMNLRRSMINHSLPITVILPHHKRSASAPPPTRAQLERQSAVLAKLSYEVVTLKATQPKFVRQDRKQRKA
jgi:hypothetical protein